MRTSKQRTCGGFTSLPWDSKGLNKQDESTFVFSVDDKKIYKPSNSDKAVGHWPDQGPVFGDSALALRGDLRTGVCATNGPALCNYYAIPCDAEGNSLLTGEGAGKEDHEKGFTCSELIVIQLV